MVEPRDDGFLARWSQRKRAARQGDAPPDPVEPPAPVPAPEASDGPSRAAALPDPATLDASSDFSAFLQQDVPVDVHRQALRRLWRLDPIYNRLDGLDDYCEDYTDKATVVKGMRTAYQVGRGFLERAANAAAPPAEPTVAPGTAEDADDAARLAAAPGEHAPAPAPKTPAPPAPPAPPAAEPASEALRRPRPLPKRG